jgi:hypothetical protein
MISRFFPATHLRKGERTFFIEKINEALIPVTETTILGKKLHTIRVNLPFWEWRILEVQEGKAIISLRYWSGKPYNSKQVEFMRLDKDSGIGIQRLENPSNFVYAVVNGNTIDWGLIAKNDGLSFIDFCEWFKRYGVTKPMAIIHFTKFRY